MSQGKRDAERQYGHNATFYLICHALGGTVGIQLGPQDRHGRGLSNGVMGAPHLLEEDSPVAKANLSHQKAKSFHARNPTLLASPPFRGLSGRGALRACLAIPGASDKEGLVLS
ncbi:hypothetical protein PCANC_04024 [Puccinia coronata f. sp. avenae]|uniref:Uncharacterized protein n=1 Tax=Puccinia coronata f. sp. avenae TaxID=200324 RepID=A0A2N5T7V7_9BASI|nr:hypothetical protein PCANC_04024 [Puccinia coronata f. sp. avenae]PLW22152.1 hypothetical protein PCASD_12248 [Puccinia coronata f. sp. avenae]